jgi:hypothetical protein
MDFVSHLWIPIVLSAAAVWFASALAWMLSPHHKQDFKKLPDEDGFVAAVRSLGVTPGSYAFPRCEHAQMKDPEFKKKWESGPIGVLNVSGKVSMGKNMLATFLVYLIVSIFIGYLGWAVFQHDTALLSKSRVFQVMGTAGVLAYSFSFIPGGIWFGQSGRSMLMGVIDGVVFGLITGGIFALLWPGIS